MNAKMEMIVVSLILVLGVSTFAAADDQAPPKTNVTITRCYVCTSETNPACGDSYNNSGKFPHETKLNKDHFVRDCANEIPKHLVPMPSAAVGCRKIMQELGDSTRVVRQCAFTGDPANGLKRTGNEGVRLWYYQCNDKDLCNGAASARFWLVSLFLPLAFALALAGW